MGNRIAIVLVALFVAACSSDDMPAGPSAGVPFTTVDLTVGAGPAAMSGQLVTVDYTGWLYDATAPDNKGAMFDTTAGGQPFTFRLGSGQVIPGWEQGIAGMRVGGTRRLIIPPELAYGSQGFGALIPPNATLIFEVDLISIQ